VPVNFDCLSRWTFEDRIHRYEAKDTILYALGVGCGEDHDDLPYIYEEGLFALPSMATVLGDPGLWLKDPQLGADWGKAVHGEQSVELHATLPISGTVLAHNTVDKVIDKGPGKGVFIYCSRALSDQVSGTQLATLRSTLIIRENSGPCGPQYPLARPVATLKRSPDISCIRTTLPQVALIYRLSGDLNPLHVVPAAAENAGFPRPILHGLCTLGIATRVLLKACCGDEPARLRSISVRFAAPVFPGETIQVDIWRNGARIDFRCSVQERGVVVISPGTAWVEM
jgi:acyl dehydratase